MTLTDYSTKLKRINRELTLRTAAYNNLIEEKERILNSISELKDKEKILHETCVLLQEACSYSRSKLKNTIENVVSSSLKEIFQDPSMGFKIEYGSSHNKTTASFLVTKIQDGKELNLDIMNECGGGVADIVSLAIRITLLLYHSNSVAKILILDEACTSISTFSGEVLTNLGKWLKGMCDKFDLQIILVTQKTELAMEADKCFKVELRNGKSEVKETRP